MEGHVSFVTQLAVKDGMLGSFEELMGEMVTGTNAEPGALGYEWYISDDKGTVHVYEKYADSDAMVSHLDTFLSTWAGRFLECVDVTRFFVYGDPSPAARKLLDGLGARYLGTWGGFSRFA